jgi:hypothetical protein
MTLYLTDFLNRTFSRQNAQIRAFYGGEKLRAAAVYHAGINQGAAQWKPALRLRRLHLSCYIRIPASGINRRARYDRVEVTAYSGPAKPKVPLPVIPVSRQL